MLDGRGLAVKRSLLHGSGDQVRQKKLKRCGLRVLGFPIGFRGIGIVGLCSANCNVQVARRFTLGLRVKGKTL